MIVFRVSRSRRARALSASVAASGSQPSKTTGVWAGSGVLGPEAFDAVPFLDLLTAYGSPWGMREGG